MTELFDIEKLRSSGTSASIFVDLQLFHFLKLDYGVFVQLINKAIDLSSLEMSRDKNTLTGMHEDQLTLLFVKPLKTMMFDVHHDKNNGGHCDIVIEGGREMVWLGEAKKFSSYGQIYGGYQQLTDRYSTGNRNQDYGSLIIYMTVNNAKDKMDKWREYLEDNVLDIKISVDSDRPLEFDSEQIHSGSGLPVYVRHVPVLLYHRPTDINPPPKRIPRKKRDPKNAT